MGRPQQRGGEEPQTRAMSSSAGTFFGGGGYSSHGEYMLEKNRKLKEQYAAVARNSVTGAQCAGKPHIFQGLTFWMTGRTCVPDQDLKRLIVEHGGVYEQYGFKRVSHIIADNLAVGNQTWRELRNRVKRGLVVTSSWVVDCVHEQRRIPETRYMPKCLEAGTTMFSFVTAPAANSVESAPTPTLDLGNCASAKTVSDCAPPILGTASDAGSIHRDENTQCHSRLQPAPLAIEISATCEGLSSREELTELLSELSDTVVSRACSLKVLCVGLRISTESFEEWSSVTDLNVSLESRTAAFAVLQHLEGLACAASDALSLACPVSKWCSVRRVEVQAQFQGSPRRQHEPQSVTTQDPIVVVDVTSPGPRVVSKDGITEAQTQPVVARQKRGRWCALSQTDGPFVKKACSGAGRVEAEALVDAALTALERPEVQKLVVELRACHTSSCGSRFGGMRKHAELMRGAVTPQGFSRLASAAWVFLGRREMDLALVVLKSLRALEGLTSPDSFQFGLHVDVLLHRTDRKSVV